MKNAVFSPARRSVYPGSFVPLLDETDVKKKFKKSAELINAVYSAVQLTESDDAVRIEMNIPGIKREDLLVYSDRELLTVWVAQANKTADNPLPQKKTQQKIHNNYFYRSIGLPEHADPEFISAEYKEDKLCLYISKTLHPIKKRHTRIAVY